jgi:Asp/Glu/hydantoin racemase
MVERIGFIHTVGFLVDEFRVRMRGELPDVDCFHVLNESLLQDLLRGKPKEAVYRRVVQQVLAAADAGADLIVMTCSSTSPAVDIARQVLNRPILKIDDPMAEAAIAAGRRIGLVCTASSTVEPSTALLRSHAAAKGREIAVVPLLQADAYTALMRGERAEHDRLIRKAVTEAAATVDAVVLAQASLAHLRDELAAVLPIPVLASPALLMQALTEHCAIERVGTVASG